LCPADVCAVGDAFCPVGPEGIGAPRAKFTIVDDIDAAQKTRYEAFLAANGIEVAGIEFIRDENGTVYTYDVNTNTNYNPDAEARAGRSAMTALARFLGGELRKQASLRAPGSALRAARGQAPRRNDDDTISSAPRPSSSR
jgi:hypothetical protein